MGFPIRECAKDSLGSVVDLASNYVLSSEENAHAFLSLELGRSRGEADAVLRGELGDHERERTDELITSRQVIGRRGPKMPHTHT